MTFRHSNTWKENETPEERLEREQARFRERAANIRRFGGKHAAKKLLNWRRFLAYAERRGPTYQVGRAAAAEARALVLPNWKRGMFLSPMDTKNVMRQFLRILGEKRIKRKPQNRSRPRHSNSPA